MTYSTLPRVFPNETSEQQGGNQNDQHRSCWFGPSHTRPPAFLVPFSYSLPPSLDSSYYHHHPFLVQGIPISALSSIHISLYTPTTLLLSCLLCPRHLPSSKSATLLPIFHVLRPVTNSTGSITASIARTRATFFVAELVHRDLHWPFTPSSDR